jgi:SHS2 domain-containing protein
MHPRFEEVEHAADLAIRAHGRDLPELFASAAYGMFSLMADLALLRPDVERQVNLEDGDYESLLIDWLNELIYLSEEHGEVYCEYLVTALSLTPAELTSRVRGARGAKVEKWIKAATFHNLSIAKTPDGYVATVVFDV